MNFCIKCKKEIPDGATFCPWCGKRQSPEPRKALKRANGTGTVYKLQGRRTRPWVAAKSGIIIGYYDKKHPPSRRWRGCKGGALMRFIIGRSRKYMRNGRPSTSGRSARGA